MTDKPVPNICILVPSEARGDGIGTMSLEIRHCHPAGAPAIGRQVPPGQREATRPEAELLTLQHLLVNWIRSWAGLWNDPQRRMVMRETSGQWAQRLLQLAGLVP